MTIEWLRERLLLDDSGLLASSLDADTVLPDGTHAEGGTYIFSDAELAEAARESGLSDEEARRAVELNRGVPADEHAVASGAPLSITAETPRTVHFDAPLNDEERALWDAMMPALRRRRASRSQPSLDRKVVASWNAQAVQSVAEAAALWEDAELLDFAESLAERLWETHTDEEGRVCRTSYAGKRGTGVGTLSDHAHLISACFALASLTRAPSGLRALLMPCASRRRTLCSARMRGLRCWTRSMRRGCCTPPRPARRTPRRSTALSRAPSQLWLRRCSRPRHSPSTSIFRCAPGSSSSTWHRQLPGTDRGGLKSAGAPALRAAVAGAAALRRVPGRCRSGASHWGASRHPGGAPGPGDRVRGGGASRGGVPQRPGDLDVPRPAGRPPRSSRAAELIVHGALSRRRQRS